MNKKNDNTSNSVIDNSVYKEIDLKFNYFKEKKTPKLKKTISDYLKEKYIFTSYSKIPKIYKILEISFDKNPNNTDLYLTIQNEKKSISIKKFYEEKYNIILKNLNQPLLSCKKIKHRINKSNGRKKERKGELINEVMYYIPLELSYIVNIDKLSDKINQIIEEKELKKDKDEINKNEDENSELYDYDINDDYYIEEKINFHHYFGKVIDIKNENNNLIIINKEDISLKKNNLIQTNLNKEKWIVFYPIIHKNLGKAFIKKIILYSKRLGINVENPIELTCGEMGKETNSHSEDMINTIINFFQKNPPFKYSIIAILYDENNEIYEKLKELFINEVGIISQFICIKKNNMNEQGYYNSIIIQMLMKIGMPIFRIDFTYFNQKNSNLMISGLNITNKGKQFIITLLSTYNNYFADFYFDYVETDFNIPKIGEEIQLLFQNALNNYNKNNHEDVENIIIYASTSNLYNSDKCKYNSNDLDLTLEICLNYLPKIFNDNIKFCLISPNSVNFQNTEKNSLFVLSKFNDKFMNYLIYQNDLNYSIEDLYYLTFKLTFYNWNNNLNLLFPNCLYYSFIVGKLLQKISMKKIKNWMKLKPFYI